MKQCALPGGQSETNFLQFNELSVISKSTIYFPRADAPPSSDKALSVRLTETLSVAVPACKLVTLERKQNFSLSVLIMQTRKFLARVVEKFPDSTHESSTNHLISGSSGSCFSCSSMNCACVLSRNSTNCVLLAIAFAC